MGPHTVSVCVLDANTVGMEGSLLRLCSAIRKLQGYGLSVVLVSREDISDAVEAEVLTLDMDRLLYFKAFNPGNVDAIQAAVSYEAFFVQNCDLVEDWRLSKHAQEWLLRHAMLQVQFSFDATGGFHPQFATGVEPGVFAIEEATARLLSDVCAMASNDSEEDVGLEVTELPGGWIRDSGSPEMAVRGEVVAIGVDEKESMQSAKQLGQLELEIEIHGQELQKLRLETPWPVLIRHRAPAPTPSPTPSPLGLFALGGSRKECRRRAARLALAVAHKLRQAKPPQNPYLQQLTRRAKRLMAEAEPEKSLNSNSCYLPLPRKKGRCLVKRADAIHAHFL